MSISCQINQKHFSVQLLLSPSPSVHPTIHPSWSSHPHAASSHLQTIQNCQQLSCDELNPRLCSTPSPALPSQLCRIGRFCAAAGRKRHRYVEAAAHHGPLHLLHRPQWVGRPTPACSRHGIVSIPSVHLMFLIVSFSFSSLSSQLTWRSAVKTRWWGWCPAGSLSAGCLSATGYWTTKSCRPSNWTTWKISVSITDRSKTGNTTWTNVASWIDLKKKFSKPVPCGEFGFKSPLFGIVSRISDMNGFIFIIPFDSLRPLLNKATWKCPFVWGGTISIFFFPLCFTLCEFIWPPVLKKYLKRMVLNWMLPPIYVTDGRCYGRQKLTGSLQPLRLFIYIMQQNLYKTFL